tara:strand:- start:49851 stop:50621 length:771 start_codon:yes stop_codon:yes gene_type:complete
MIPRFIKLPQLILLLSITGYAVAGADVEDSLKVVSKTNSNAVQSQQRIDTLSRETAALLDEYRKLLEGSEYQAAYNRELEQLEAVQEAQIAELREQIAAARVTRQRIVPLMRSMADALEQFVVLDLPFHHEDRITAVLQLKRRLALPELSVAAKFRLLLEAYQLEQEYGDTLEAWRGPVQLGGQELSVEFLRVGRVALYFQSLDGLVSGYWDAGKEAWVTLESQHNRSLAQALRVANSLSAPQLLSLPMKAGGAGS